MIDKGRNIAAAIVGLGFLAAAGLAVVIAGRPDAGGSGVPRPSPGAIASATEAPRLPEPVLDRAALLDLARKAASVHALGANGTGGIVAFAGMRFELAMPIGCEGPLPDGTAASGSGWRYAPAERSLRVSARPEDWSDAGWREAILPEREAAAVEGFWIERSWLLDAACPRPAGPEAGASAVPSEAAPLPARGAEPAAPRIGIVQLTAPDAPRSSTRSGRAYTAVVRRAPDRVAADDWFVLTLSGRLHALADGAPVACEGDGLVAPPLCLIGADIERVTIADRQGEVLAEWQR